MNFHDASKVNKQARKKRGISVHRRLNFNDKHVNVLYTKTEGNCARQCEYKQFRYMKCCSIFCATATFILYMFETKNQPFQLNVSVRFV